MIEKLISINTLKNINFMLRKINDNEISTIKGENKTVTDILINCKNKKECIIYNLQNKFINLRNITIKTTFADDLEGNIEIRENPICNIKELNIYCYSEGDIKVYIQSFENLVKFNLYLVDIDIKNKEKIFPFFNK